MNYFIKKLLTFPFLVLLINAVNFIIVKSAPGDPVIFMIGGTSKGITPEIVNQIRVAYGFDQPIYIQFYLYISRFFRGDLGYSYYFGGPVAQLVADRLVNTLLLTATAFFFSVSIGIIMGVVSAHAKGRNSKVDSLVSTIFLITYSVPQYWMGIIVLVVFGVYLGWFPVAGMHSTSIHGGGWLDLLHHLILPVTVLSLANVVLFSRFMRASLLEELSKDYIVTARSKGCSERQVLFRHAFKNSLLPLITQVSMRLPWIFTGAVLIEMVFSWPGIGLLLMQAIFARDYNIVVSIFAVTAILVISCSIIADMIYAYADPAIRYAEES